MTAQKAEERLTDFLSAETKKNIRNAKWTWTLGVGLVVLFGGYMTYVGYMLKTRVLNPYHLAAVVATKVNDDAPRILSDVESQLIGQAPIVMAQLNSDVFDMLPYLERVGEKQVDVLVELVPELDAYSEATLDRFYDKHGKDLGAFLKAHDDEEAINQLIDQMYNEMVTQIDKKFQVQYAGHKVSGARELSLAHLSQLNRYFNKLANVHPFRMTPSERLQRRLIVAWSRTFRKLLKLEEV